MKLSTSKFIVTILSSSFISAAVNAAGGSLRGSNGNGGRKLDGPQQHCGVETCTEEVWNAIARASDTGETYTCGQRITFLQTDGGFTESDACNKITNDFPDTCTCSSPSPTPDDPSITPTNTPQPSSAPEPQPSQQKCGGCVNTSGNKEQTCKEYLWDPTGGDDTSMQCYAYGGSSDPCSLNNNNDVNDGLDKDPSLCNYGDSFYLWDEPDTQGRSYTWAGTNWLQYSKRFASQLQEMRSHGIKVTSPLLRAGGDGTLLRNMDEFMNACGSPCSDPNNPAYIDVIAANGYCGPWSSSCAAGADFTFQQANQVSSRHGNLPVYVTNWSKLQTDNSQDEVEAIDAISNLFPDGDNGIIKRVYWFGATDYGGGSHDTSFLTRSVQSNDGSQTTLGELYKQKCDSL